MFIIEKMVDDHRRAVEAWERSRDKWLNSATEWDYRSARQYEERHPRPGHTLKVAAKTAAIVVCVALLGILIFGFAREIAKENKNKPKKQEHSQVANLKNGAVCSKYHIGDTGYIDYGDYEGAHVKIVGGCDDNEDYQVITLEDQTLFGKGSKHEQLDDKFIKAGLTFGVNSSDNITVTGHDKE